MPRRLDNWRTDPSQVVVLLHDLRGKGELRGTMGLHPGRPARALGSTCETIVFRNWVQRRPVRRLSRFGLELSHSLSSHRIVLAAPFRLHRPSCIAPSFTRRCLSSTLRHV